MKKFKLGVASVTFRNKTVEEVVRIAKNAGVSYIEWGGDVHVKTLEDARKVKKLCDENEIKISSYGTYYRVGFGNDESRKSVCEIASEMGASSIRVWLGNKDSEKTDAQEYENLLSDLRNLCETAKEYSILVCPECHDNTFNNNTDAFLKIRNDLGLDNFRTYFQSRYFRFDYDIDRIERTFDYIENIHVSYRDLKKEQRFRKKDRAYLDKLLIKLSDMGFDGIVMVEFTKGSKEKNFVKDIKKLNAIGGRRK